MRYPVPTYDALLTRSDGPAGSSWGLFGADDELGTLNFITPDRVKHAASLVRRGATFNLDKALDAFQPPVVGHRRNPEHRIISNHPSHRDDYLNGFYLQGSTQIDSLRHFGHPDHGFYNGRSEDAITTGSPSLGINRYAERGIVGRGVLIDVDRYLQFQRRGLDHRAGEAFPAALLDEIAQSQGVSLMSGDILMFRTGWMAHYYDALSSSERAALPHTLKCPGLLQERATTQWLWDHQIAVIASDNVGVEAFPPAADSPFVSEVDRTAGVTGGYAALMHPTLIGLLGFCLGELWDLEALAADCARTGIYECMVTCKPLNLVGGVGSPANAVAIL